MEEQRILAVVPAFNESGNIQKTIREIQSLPFSVDVLVVNDASVDKTAQEAAAMGVDVVSLPYNLGIGGAVQTGLKFASRKQYNVVVQVDGDGQHDVAFLPALITPVVRSEADMVIGSRFLNAKPGYRSSFLRRVGIQFFVHLISFLIRMKVTDPTSGFRAFGKKSIAVFAQHYPYDYPEPESVVIAQRIGLRLKEVPVVMRKREAGHSSIRYLRTFYYMLKVTFAILLTMIKSKKGMGYGN